MILNPNQVSRTPLRTIFFSFSEGSASAIHRDLSRLVAGELGERLTPKQQVLLSMVRDGYWSQASGFYERVLRRVPEHDLRSLSETLGLDRVCAELGRESG